MKRFIIHQDDILRAENAKDYIDNLPTNRKWKVEICEYRKKRSLDQNSYIHAVPFPIFIDYTGNSLEEIKAILCGLFIGTEKVTILGEEIERPIKTTSQMNTLEMTKFIEWMQWFGSTHNLRIPSPNEWDGEY